MILQYSLGYFFAYLMIGVSNMYRVSKWEVKNMIEPTKEYQVKE